MEEGQDAKNSVVTIEHENLSHLADVGKNIVVGKHYALGVASTAAGKNNCRQIFCGGEARVQGLLEELEGQSPSQHRSYEFLAQLRRFQHFFQQEFAGRNFNSGETLEESVGGDNSLQIALPGTGGENFVVCGVIQIDRHTSEQSRRVINQCAAHGRRQQNTHHFLVFPKGPQSASNKNALYQQAAKGNFGHATISGGEAQRSSSRGTNQRAVQSAFEIAICLKGGGL